MAARPSPAAALFALLLPPVFLHIQYQPSVAIGLGASEATLYLSDVAVLAIGALGLFVGIRGGFDVLRTGRGPFLAAGGFLLVVFAATLYGPALGDDYAFVKHALTAAKLAEYGLLAFAVPLVVRRPADLRPALWTLTVWSAAASLVAVLQFLGLVNELEGRRPGQREPSFLGIHDLAALSGATLALGLATIALRRERRLGLTAGIAGAVGLALSGAVAGVVGLAAAGVLVGLLGRPALPRVAALVAIVVSVGACVVALRTVDTRPLLNVLGIERTESSAQEVDASWKQRFALAYIGGRIFLAHPLVGVGFQGSQEQEHYQPYVADARRKFSDVPPRAFPSRQHPWGVQNAYVQAAADMGILGVFSFLALFVAAIASAWRVARRAPPELVYITAVPMLWAAVAMGVWLGLGLVAGIPLVGLTWLSVGLAAATAGWVARD